MLIIKNLGHNFWDTEIWMFPPIALINPTWAKQLLNYRFKMLSAAQNYANATGWEGARYTHKIQKLFLNRVKIFRLERVNFFKISVTENKIINVLK